MSAPFGVYLHTLGCPKNEADSGALGRRLLRSGVPLVAAPDEATHIVVNTCGFIEAAREESIEAILDAGAAHPRARVLVMGCLVERYREELMAGLPEVAAWFGLAEAAELERYLALERGRAVRSSSASPAEPSTGEAAVPTFSHIKVSDGCDHLCSFCAIPAIKGPYAALDLEAVWEQTRHALAAGAGELILVGQDTAIWRHGELDLLGLVDSLLEDQRVRRIRLLYLQPEHVSDRLLEGMAAKSRLCRYLDIPFQHASAPVLRRMARAGDGASYLELVGRARRLMPDVSLRSTFIVGFPGETDDDVEALLEFVGEARLDHAGVFAYSPEEGTSAAALSGRIPPEVVAERLTRVGQALIDSGEEAAALRVGDEVRVLVESLGDEDAPAGAWGVGRTCAQAPDIDGISFVTGVEPPDLRVGSYVAGVVEEAAGFDLLVRADVVEASS